MLRILINQDLRMVATLEKMGFPLDQIYCMGPQTPRIFTTIHPTQEPYKTDNNTKVYFLKTQPLGEEQISYYVPTILKLSGSKFIASNVAQRFSSPQLRPNPHEELIKETIDIKTDSARRIYGPGLALNQFNHRSPDSDIHTLRLGYSGMKLGVTTGDIEDIYFGSKPLSTARSFIGIEANLIKTYSFRPADTEPTFLGNFRIISYVYLGDLVTIEKYTGANTVIRDFLFQKYDETETANTPKINFNLFYDDKLARILPKLAAKVKEIPVAKSVDTKILRNISAKKETISLPEYSALKRAEEAVNKKIDSMKKLEEIIAGSGSNIKRSENLIEDHKLEIEFLLQKIKVMISEFETATTQAEPERKVLSNIQEEKLKREQAFKEASEQLLTQENIGQGLLNTLENLGYVVTALEYTLNGKTIDATKDLTVIFNKDAAISKVRVQAKNPSIITSYNYGTPLEKKHACGPLKFTVTFNHGAPTVTVGAVDLNSIFGFNTNGGTVYYWAHPHIAQQSFYAPTATFKDTDWAAIENYLLREYQPCQGEMTPALSNAAKNNDLLSIIFTLKQWSESARVDDAYGANVGYFPLATAIKTSLDPESKTTEEAKPADNLDNLLNTLAGVNPQTTITTAYRNVTLEQAEEEEPDDEFNEENEDDWDDEVEAEEEAQAEEIAPAPVNNEYRPYRRTTNQG